MDLTFQVGEVSCKEEKMSDAQLSLFAGALLSLAFSYVPGLREWFDTKDSTTKRLIMAGALLVVAGLAFAAACGQVLPGGIAVTCDRQGGVELATNFLLALVANQATYIITKKKTVKESIPQ